MTLLILIALINLSLGQSVSLNNGGWVTPPVNISAFMEQSALSIWLLFDVNYRPVILNVNYSSPNASSTVPGTNVSTYSINQETLNSHTLAPLSGDNNATYFINFPSSYTVSPAGSMISLQIRQDTNGINQIFYQYNDLQVDNNTVNGFKSFIKDLTSLVETLVQEVILVGTETIDDFKDYQLNISSIVQNLRGCASGLSDLKGSLKDVHDHVKAGDAGSAVKSVFGTSSSLISLFLNCTGQKITIPDKLENATECGGSLIDLAEAIAQFSIAPESFITDVTKLVPLIQGLPTTMSTCTGAFSLNSTAKNIPSSGSGYLTAYTINTLITISQTYRTSDYFGILFVVDNSTLTLIAVQFDTNTSKSFNLTANLDSISLSNCASGGAIGSDSLFCVWVETTTSGSNSFVIKGVVIDAASGVMSSNAQIWVQSNSLPFSYVQAFVTSESYGLIYLYEESFQFYAISNLNTTSCNLGTDSNDRIVLSLATINDSYIYVFWESTGAQPTNVTYEKYEVGCVLVGDEQEIISYDYSQPNTDFSLYANGAGVYGLIQSGSTFQLGLVVSSPIGLVSSLFLLYSTIMCLFLL